MEYRPDASPSKRGYSDPIQVLKGEHHVTLARLEMIERTLQYLQTLPPNSAPDRAGLEQVRLKEWVVGLEKSLELHFKKEEESLFPVLSQYIGREQGPIEVMLREHTTIRRVFHAWKVYVCELQLERGMERRTSLKEVTTRGYEVIQLLRLHISKENQILFEICEVSLTLEEKQRVSEAMREVKISLL
ncbi:MAG: hemerythrin domain-containing protein [Nitrospiria bacterium]